MQVVGCRVEDFGVVSREEYREVPLKAILHAFGTMAHRVVRLYIDGAGLIRLVILAGEEAVIAAPIYYVIVGGVDGDVR